MSFFELLFAVLSCLVMFIIIFMNLYIDEENYKQMKVKTYKLYIFKDGTQVLEKRISNEKLDELEQKHGDLVEVIEDEVNL